jgi:hypothetical protein
MLDIFRNTPFRISPDGLPPVDGVDGVATGGAVLGGLAEVPVGAGGVDGSDVAPAVEVVDGMVPSP